MLCMNYNLLTYRDMEEIGCSVEAARQTNANTRKDPMCVWLLGLRDKHCFSMKFIVISF